MSIPDAINGGFEFSAGLLSTVNIRRLWHDKKVQGVDWRVTAFFSLWGFWNLYFYPHLGQILSFLGGISIFGTNIVWVCMAIYFTQKGKKNENQA